MACGKPPDPDRITEPTQLGHPVVHVFHRAVRDAESVIERTSPGKEIDSAIAWAERALKQADAAGVKGRDLQLLVARLGTLKGFAQSRMRDNAPSPAAPRDRSQAPTSAKWVATHWSEKSAVRNAPTVIRALEDKTHWQSKAYSRDLIRLVEGNTKIPQEYKEQLPKDVAQVLKVCPNAAGLVKAMTLRGQHTPMLSRAKLGSDAKSAIGSAYELMGTAALISKQSTPVNHGPKLYIDPAFDKVAFGIKSNMNRQMNAAGLIELPTRRTIECDILIGQPTALGLGWREIGVDFKHGQGGNARYASEDLKNQVENVARAIRHGQLHEYHFVTNTTFGQSFRQVIDDANKSLAAEGHQVIAYHERVTSLPPKML